MKTTTTPITSSELCIPKIEQFHNEHPEAARPPVTGEITNLARSLPESEG
jgi:hypothetical protein